MNVYLFIAFTLVLLGLAVLVRPVASRSRMAAMSGPRIVPGGRRTRAPRRADSSKSAGMSMSVARPACALAGFAAYLLLGSGLGIVAGAIVALGGPLVLARLEPRGTRLRRQQLEASAPMVADLMAACLASGTSTAAATVAVTQALPGPIAKVLGNCVEQLRLGADPVRVWGALADEPALSPIARAILRSADSGAPLADVLLRLATDLRSQRRARLEAAARAIGVRAVAPLGICFLPAFMLLGVVPLVASLFQQVLP